MGMMQTIENQIKELEEENKELREENKKLEIIISGMEWQKRMDSMKVNYQWGKFIYYTEKLEELLSEMKSKISDEEEENEYEVFMKERTEG